MALKGTPGLLLLLAAALVLLGASAIEDSPYGRFLLQHFNANPKGRDDKYCTDRMRYVMRTLRKMDPNPGTPVCKDRNTFIHGNSDDIRAVCTNKGGRDYQNMRQSIKRFQVTTCTLRGGPKRGEMPTLQECRYRAAADYRTIVIACNATGFPVHFAESQI